MLAPEMKIIRLPSSPKSVSK